MLQQCRKELSAVCSSNFSNSIIILCGLIKCHPVSSTYFVFRRSASVWYPDEGIRASSVELTRAPNLWSLLPAITGEHGVLSCSKKCTLGQVKVMLTGAAVECRVIAKGDRHVWANTREPSVLSVFILLPFRVKKCRYGIWFKSSNQLPDFYEIRYELYSSRIYLYLMHFYFVQFITLNHEGRRTCEVGATTESLNSVLWNHHVECVTTRCLSIFWLITLIDTLLQLGAWNLAGR